MYKRQLFAHCFLRPAAAQLEPPQRLRLMAAVLGPFLNAVLAAIVLILATGAVMIGQEAAQAARSGGAGDRARHAGAGVSRLHRHLGAGRGAADARRVRVAFAAGAGPRHAGGDPPVRGHARRLKRAPAGPAI